MNVQKLKYPVESYRNNIIITPNGDIWAYYFVRAKHVPLQDLNKVNAEKTEFRYTMQELGKQFKEFDLSLYPYEVNLQEQYEELAADFDKHDPEIPEYYVQRTIDALEVMYGKITKPRYLFGVKLREFNEVTNRVEQLKGGVSEVKENIFDILGGGKKSVDELYEQIYQEEEDLFQEINGFQPIRLTTEDNAYMQKLNFLRNSNHSMNDELREQNLSEITEAIIDPAVKRGMIAVETEYGTQYLSFLPISDLPDYLLNARLFYRTQNVPFPCEFHLKARPIPSDGAFSGVKAKVNSKRKIFKTNFKEVAQSGDPASKRLAINMKKTEMIQDDIEEDLTIFEFTACFVVYGSSPEICRDRVRYLRKWLGKQKVKLECPIADQLKLFYAYLQGSSKSIKHWHQFANEHGLAEFMYGVTNELGNNIGFPIGVQTDQIQSIDKEKAIRQSRKVVYWNPLAINQNVSSATTVSPHIEITGKTGSGKSFLMKLLFYILQLMNVNTLYFDPKLEMARISEELLADEEFIKRNPHFAKILLRIKYITLDSRDKKNHGVLDPLVFLPASEAKTVAEGILYQIYDLDKNDRIRLTVIETLNYFVEERAQGKEVGLWTLVEALKNHKSEEVRNVGKVIQNEVSNSVLDLLFSDGSTEGISLDYHTLVLSVAGLTLPNPKARVNEYDKKEKKSIAVMLCVGKFIRLFGNQDETQYTYEFFDESWTLKRSSIGREIFNEIIRVGRSQCNACIFGDQSTKKDEESDQISGQVGMAFAFDEDSERPEILQSIGMPNTPQNIELLRNLKQGQCLFRDTYDRTNKLTVWSFFPEWTYANKTVERTASGDLEEKYA